MNHIYKSIFNKALGVFTAVPEFASAHGKGSERTVVGRVAKGTAGFAASALAISVGLALTSTSAVAGAGIYINDGADNGCIAVPDAAPPYVGLYGISNGAMYPAASILGPGQQLPPISFAGLDVMKPCLSSGANATAVEKYDSQTNRTLFYGKNAPASVNDNGAKNLTLGGRLDVNSGIIGVGDRGTNGAGATNSIRMGTGTTLDEANKHTNAIAIGVDTATTAEGAVAISAEAKARTSYSIAIGRNATAGGDMVPPSNETGAAIAIGRNSLSNFIGAVALGNGATVSPAKSGGNATDGIAIGTKALVDSYRGMAIGANSQAKGSQSIVLANNVPGAKLSTASGIRSQVYGVESEVSGSNSVAMGSTNTVASHRTYAIGNNINVAAGADDSLVFGTQANVGARNSIAMGNTAQALAGNSTAIGSGTTAQTGYSTALGYQAQAGDPAVTNFNGEYTTAIGGKAKALHAYTTALGAETNASGAYATAVGNEAKATHESTTAVGKGAKATNDFATAVGQLALASGKNGTAVGTRNEALGEEATALGYHSHANGSQQLSIGAHAGRNLDGSFSQSTHGISIGSLAGADNATAKSNDDSVLIGTESGRYAQGGDRNTSIGKSAGQYLKGSDNIAMGTQAGTGTATDKLVVNNTTAIGNTAKALTSDSVAIGTSAQAGKADKFSGERAVAVGYNAQALGSAGIAIGEESSTTNGHNGVAIGAYSKTSNEKAISIGAFNAATGAQSIVMAGNYDTNSSGPVSVASGTRATVIGAETTVSGNNSVAIGDKNTVASHRTYAMGNNINAAVDADDSLAFGTRVTAGARNSIAMGKSAQALAGNATAIGADAQAKGIDSIAMGLGATVEDAAGFDGIAIGTRAKAKEKGMAVGAYSQADGVESGVFANAVQGKGSTASGRRSSIIGVESTVSGNNSVAIGDTNTVASARTYAMGNNINAAAGTDDSLAFGTRAAVEGANTIAMGNTAKALTDSSISIGQNAESGKVDKFDGKKSIAIGYEAKSMGTSTIAMGYNAKSENGHDGVSIGTYAKSDNEKTITIGSYSSASGAQSIVIANNYNSDNSFNSDKSTATGRRAIVMGAESHATAEQALAIGDKNTVAGARTYAIGNNINVAAGADDSLVFGTRAAVGGANTVAIGANANAAQANSVALGAGSATSAPHTGDYTLNNSYTAAGLPNAANGTVSVGSAGKERQIQNVAAGVISATSTDAINGSQLYATNNYLSNLAGGVKNVLGGDAAVDNAGNLTMSDVGGTGKGNVHEAIAAVKGVADTAVQEVESENPTALSVKKDGTKVTLTPNFITGDLVNADGTVNAPATADEGKLVSAKTVADALKANHFVVDTKANGGKTEAGSEADAKVGSGNKVTFEAGKNLVAQQTNTANGGATVNYKLSDTLENLVSVKSAEIEAGIGPNKVVLNNNGVKVGDSTLNDKGLTINNGPSVTDTGIDAGNKKITGVADGNVAAGSTDAVNGGQLAAVKAKADSAVQDIKSGDEKALSVTKAGNTYTITPNLSGDLVDANGNITAPTTPADKGKLVTAGTVAEALANTHFVVDTKATDGELDAASQADQKIKASNKVTLQAGKNLKAKQTNGANGAEVEFSLKDSISLKEVKVGEGSANEVVLNNNGVNVAGNTYINKDGLNANGNKVANVKAGDVSATSTDAVNGAQLHNVATSVANVLGGNAAVDGNGNVTSSDIGGTGKGTVHDAIAAVNATAAKHTTVVEGKNVKVTKGKNAAGGDEYTVATKDDLDVTSVTAGNTTVNTNGLTITGGPSVTRGGIDAGNRIISGVKAGDVSATSQEAVNGSQLHATNTKLDGVKAKADTAVQDVKSGDENALTAVKDPNTNIVTVTPKLSGDLVDANGNITAPTTPADKGKLVTAGTVADALANTHFVVDTKATDGELDAASQADQKIKAGNKVTLQAGKNLKAKQTNGANGAQVEFSLKDSISLKEVTAGEGDNQVVLGNDGVKVGGNTYINKDGLNANNKVISNVADGVNPNDAVNKGQLDAVGKEAAKHTTVKAGKNVEVTEGTNAAGGKEYTVKTADNLDVTSVKAGDSTLNTDGLTIAGGPSVKKDGINAGDKKITNVAPGAVTPTSKDAVNGSQLYNVANNVKDLIGPDAKIDPATGKVTVADPAKGIGETGKGTIGDAIKHVNDAAKAAAETAAKHSSVKAGNNIVVTEGTNSAGGKEYTVKTADNLDVTSVKAGDTTVNNDGLTIAGGPSVTKDGINAGGKNITGVAAGVNDTDAVNKGQLDKVVKDGVANVAQNVVNVLGGDAAVNSDGNITMTNIGDTGKGNVNDAIKAVNDLAKKAAAEKTSVKAKDGRSNVTVTEGTNAAGGHEYTVDVERSVTNAGSDYVTVTNNHDADSNTTTYTVDVSDKTKASLAKADSAVQGLTSKDGNLNFTKGANGNVEVSFNDNLNVKNVTTDRVQVANGPSMSKDGINAAGKAISNVANGNVAKDSKDAVNGGQLHETAQSVADVIGGGATVKDGKVVAGQNGIGNTGQNTVHGAIAAINQNTANNFNQIRGDLRKMDRDLRGGIAGALATAGLPQAFRPGKSMVAAAASTYRGQSGLAIGVSRISDNGKVILKVTGNTNSRGDFGGTIGAGYQW